MTGLSLADMGSYMVGGRGVAVQGKAARSVSLSPGMAGVTYDPNGHFHVEQAYVQYFIPERRLHPLPLVLVHGGGLTGATWETTPDGRAGWLSDFIAAGFEVHVVDMVERGRAGFCALPDLWPDAPIMRSAEEAWSLFRIGTADDFARRRPFDGQAFPTGQFDELVARLVPRWTHTGAAQAAALEALALRLGPCLMVGHSQGGGHVVDLAARRPDLVQGAVVLEPHGPFEAIRAAAPGGRPLLLVEGDFLDLAPDWVDLGARFGLCLSAWDAAGGRAERLVLADHGMEGHSHMMMMDRGGARIAGHIADWLKGVAA